jgi:two-component system chemotaxis response regulator CheB
MGTTETRDIVVIGTSAGGIDALPRLIGHLPPGLPAALFVCQHLAATKDPQLANILRRSSALPVSWAEQGERIRRGHVYVAPPDLHLTFIDDHLRLARGPRENYARPSIDRLFRSAAQIHGGRVIGVILTGMMSDGVAGALAVQQAGGRVIVQAPSDALFPELPSRTLAVLTPDATLPVEQIATAIVDWTREQAPAHHPAHVAPPVRSHPARRSR